VSANSCVRKDLWEPSSKRILASASVCSEVIVATAVFNKHVWFVGALCGLVVKVVSEAVSAVGVAAVCPSVPLKLFDVAC